MEIPKTELGREIAKFDINNKEVEGEFGLSSLLNFRFENEGISIKR